MQNYKAIIQALKHLRDNGPYRNNSGICFNTYSYLPLPRMSRSTFDDIMYQYFCTWEYFSGSNTYPIPGGCQVYNSVMNLWTGKQLKYRMHLINYLIKELEKDCVQD